MLSAMNPISSSAAGGGGSGITSLGGDVVATGPGAATAAIQSRVIIASMIALGTITSALVDTSIAKTTDLASYTLADGSRAFTGDQSFGGHAITNVSTLTTTGLVTAASLKISGLGAGIAHVASDGTVSSSLAVNADISASAAVVVSKLAGGTDAQLLLTSTTTPTWASMSGDATISNTGALTIGALAVTAAKIAAAVTYTLTGDVTGSATKVGSSMATTIATSVYTAPGTIGSGTPNTGAFTTLSTSGAATFASPVSIGATPATAGDLRLLSAFTAQFRNNANSGNVVFASANSSDAITVGNGASTVTLNGGTLLISSANTLTFQMTGGPKWQTNSGTGTLTVATSRTQTATVYEHSANTTDLACASFTVHAQDAFASATGTNRNGGILRIKGGAPVTAGTTGLRGPTQISVGALDADIMIEAFEVVVGQRGVAFCRRGAMTSTEMTTNTGDGVIFIGNAATDPTASAVSGGILFVSSGALKWRGSSGTVTTLGAA